MKLTTEQIKQIKALVADKGITFPDVQLEIIDHVASRVEELMNADPQLTFTAAMDVTDAEFGEKGFKGFEAGMISAMRKKYFRLFCSTFLSWFRWKYIPAIVLFAYVIGRTYMVVNTPKAFVIGSFALFAIAFAVAATQFGKYRKYNSLLTMKIGMGYVLILNAIIDLWNLLGIGLKLYQYVSVYVTGIIFASVIVLVALLFLTIKNMARISLEASEQLNQQYQLLTTN